VTQLSPPKQVQAIERPPTADLLILAVALTAVSTSGPLMAAITAPALAIAFWRNALGAAALTPFALWRHRSEFGRLGRFEWLAALAAGLALGGHFAAWCTSLTMTSVASATAFVAGQPIFAAFIARLRGETVSRRAWLGILIACAGVVALSGSDLQVSGRAFAGDLLALVGGALAAVYMSFGAKVRQTVSLTPYAVICYSAAAVVLAIGATASGQSLSGMSADSWIKILTLTATAQLLGHTLFNRVLKTTSATVVATLILIEVPAAALIAAIWLGQVPSWTAIPGAALILAGLAVVTTTGRQTSVPPEDPLL
jgi:drug/metabolite transporter (DMT)-like permease